MYPTVMSWPKRIVVLTLFLTSLSPTEIHSLPEYVVKRCSTVEYVPSEVHTWEVSTREEWIFRRRFSLVRVS